MIVINVHTALVAVQSIDERLPALRARAGADARYQTELLRVETARAALDAAISFAYASSTPGVPTP